MIEGFPETPAPLIKKGYTIREEPTAFLWRRDVYCTKRIGRADSDLVFDIQVKYELNYSDPPSDVPSSQRATDYFYYCLDTVFLLVWLKTDRESSDGLPELSKVGESELFVSSFAKLEQIADALGQPILDGFQKIGMVSTEKIKAKSLPKHSDLLCVIENKYDRHIQTVVEGVRELPSSSGECEIDNNAWEDWRREQRDQPTVANPEKTTNFVYDACLKLVQTLPEDERVLLWLMTSEYIHCKRCKAPWTYGEPMQNAVAGALYRRIRAFAASPRIKLHRFILKLVDDWNRDRAEDPEGMPSAAKVTALIWDAEETTRFACLEDDANALTIADVLIAETDYFQGSPHEMEDYINRLTPRKREQMCLPGFTEIFYGVLCGGGAPD